MTSIFIRDVFSSMLIPVFWIILIYLAVFFAIRWVSSSEPEIGVEHGIEDRDQGSKSALRLLDERFAKGEIKNEEYSDTKTGLLERKVKKKKSRKNGGKRAHSAKDSGQLHKFD